MGKKKWAGIILVIIFLSAAFGAWYGFRAGKYRLTGVSQARYQNGILYLTDNGGENYDLFQLNEKGEILSSLSLPKLQGNWRWEYRLLTTDETGQEYVYGTGHSMTTAEAVSMVYWWDTKQEKLVPFWEVPSGARISTIQVQEGRLYYASADSEGKAAFYRQNREQERELLFQTETPYREMVLTYYRIEENSPVWSDYRGRIFAEGREMELSGKAWNRGHIFMGKDGVWYTDFEEKSLWFQPYGSPQRILQMKTEILKLPEGLEDTDLFPLDYTEEGIWLAGADIEKDRRVLGIITLEGECIALKDSVNYPVSVMLWRGIRAFIETAALALALTVGIWYIFEKKQARLPILVKILLFLIPAAAVSSSFFIRKVEEGLEDRILKMEEELLYVLADQELSRQDPKLFGMLDIYRLPHDAAYEELFQQTDFYAIPEELYQEDQKHYRAIASQTYLWYFFMGEDGLRYLDASYHYLGSLVAYDRNDSQIKEMETAMREKRAVPSRYNDQNGDWVVVYVPIFDETGKAVGVLESGMNIGLVLYEGERQTRRVVLVIGTVMLIFLAITAATLLRSLSPLRALEKAVKAMEQGELGQEVKTKRRDEIGHIARSFNAMSGHLEKQVKYIEESARGYEKFVPRQVFELLNRKDITEIRLGDQGEREAAVLTMESTAFERLSRNLEGKALYGLTNRMMELAIPVMMERKGVIQSMEGGQITAFYIEGGAPALWSSVEICRKAEGEELPPFCLTITYGLLRVGIAGNQQRMTVAAIADMIPLSQWIASVGEKYGAKILITKTAADTISEFSERFHSRRLGCVYLRHEQRLEWLYDVYDGDSREQYVLKEETAGIFSRAVKDYEAGRYYEARQKFASVLKKNRKDLAAQQYIFRCDGYYRMKDTEERKIYLEEY